MRLIPGHWFIGFCELHPLFYIVLLVLIMAVVHSKKVTKPIVGMSALLILAVAFYSIGAWWKIPEEVTSTLGVGHGSIILLKRHKEVMVIDDGSLSRQTSLESWFEYTLIPEVLKKTGSSTIDHLVITSNCERVFKALKNSLVRLSVKNIYLPGWKGMLPARHYYAYKDLKKAAEQKKCSLVFMFECPRSISSFGVLKPQGWCAKPGYESMQFSCAIQGA